MAMLYLIRVCLDDLFTEFLTSVCIDGIQDPAIKAVVHVAAFISDQHLHINENILAHTKLPERFVLIKMWFCIARFLGVTKKGIEQYESLIIGLVQVLQVSPLQLGFSVILNVYLYPSMKHAYRYSV
jgi:hypothetical protein